MDSRPVGIFDSGLGGLTVFKSIMQLLPHESMVYFGDTGRVPYGTKSRETVLKYAAQDIRFLMQHDIKAIVIACGTASSIALEAVRQQFDIPIIGVVQPTAAAAAAKTRNKRIGLLGTNATIKSGAYERMLQSLDREIAVTSVACPLFVPLVENGYTGGPVAEAIAQEYLAPLKKDNVDTIILGCTHYPLLKDTIRAIMGERVSLVDAGLPTAACLEASLEQTHQLAKGPSQYRYYISDEVESFTNLASVFLGKEIYDRVEKVEIENY